MLSEEDRATLLDLARTTAAAAARGDAPPVLRNPSGALREKGAAFVTLRVAGELRGCIGHIEAVLPLWESVRDMTDSAAARDSRFAPLHPPELAGLRIEISVLSPMKPIGPSGIEVGTHGLYVKRGTTTGLLLPQVAVEWKWSPAEFLQQTYRKAGLPPDAPGVELFGFTVEKFATSS